MGSIIFDVSHQISNTKFEFRHGLLLNKLSVIDLIWWQSYGGHLKMDSESEPESGKADWDLKYLSLSYLCIDVHQIFKNTF